MQSLPLTPAQSGFFDTVRGGLAVYCAFVHAAAIFGLLPDWAGLPNRLLLHLFFVLSGFLIHRSLLKRRSVRAYVEARASRLLPPFFAAIGLAVALTLLAPFCFPFGTAHFATATVREGMNLRYLAPTVLLVNGLFGGTLSANGPLYTLAYEAWLYAVVALCLAGSAWKHLGRTALAAICLRTPDFTTFALAWLAGWLWSVVSIKARAPIPGWRVGILARAAPFSYTLYAAHFPILLFIYGATGEQGWMMMPAWLATVALSAWLGPTIERSGPTLLRWWKRRSGKHEEFLAAAPFRG